MATLQELVLPKSALPENPELEISRQIPIKHPAPWPWPRYGLAGERSEGLVHGMPHPTLLPALFGGSQLRPALARFA